MVFDNLTYEQCVAQGIGPLVFPERLRVTGDGLRVTDAERMKMKAVCMSTMQQQVHLQHTLEQAWQALEKAGIRAVLMKGAGLAACYPAPERRPWGDIDLFVGKNQYHPACAVMRETFPKALKFDEELDHYKHYNLIADGISIEIHRVSVGLQHPLDERRYARFEHEGMTMSEERLTINGLEVRVPEPTFNVLFVFLHSWEHAITQGACLRQLYDLSFLMQHYADRIDYKRLHAYLRALHLEEPWAIYRDILENRPTDNPFLTDMLNGKLVEPKQDKIEATNRFVRKYKTMQARLGNARRIRRYSPAYARHMVATTLLHGASRLFAKDRKWE